MAMPSTQETIKKQVTVLDLDTFEDVTLVKVGTFAPVADAKEALARVNHDSVLFLQIVNDGLRSHAQEQLGSNGDPWQVKDEEDGSLSTFSGTPADRDKVNALRLTLAKTVFDYKVGKEYKAHNQKAKAAAMEMIKTNEAMKAGLKVNAADVKD